MLISHLPGKEDEHDPDLSDLRVKARGRTSDGEGRPKVWKVTSKEGQKYGRYTHIQ